LVYWLQRSYVKLLNIGFAFYLIIAIIATVPLIMHIFSFEGNYMDKCKSYLKTNAPAYQVLLFISCFFFGCFLATLIPALSCITWWQYLILIVILAIKPMKSNMFW
jgi:hypothetical protein